MADACISMPLSWIWTLYELENWCDPRHWKFVGVILVMISQHKRSNARLIKDRHQAVYCVQCMRFTVALNYYNYYCPRAELLLEQKPGFCPTAMSVAAIIVNRLYTRLSALSALI